jgi:hypothetical protein
VTEARLIPADIRKRLHEDMDKLFDLQEQNGQLRAQVAQLTAENVVLRKNQRVRPRPSTEESAEADNGADQT